MKVYALVGPSGTGKSYKSLYIAGARKIDAVIDDGLLIVGYRVIAGESAKKEPTKIAAIRRAIFADDCHAEQIKKAINSMKIRSILILGTSDRMVETIAKRLDLPPVSEIIRIEDVSKPWEIQKAHKNRNLNGTHVIPVPVFEVKNSFSGYFIDPLKIFRRMGKRSMVIEKTLVRPTYSYMGKYEITDMAIASIVEYEAERVEGVTKAGRVSIYKEDDGIQISVEIVVRYGLKMREIAKDIQKSIKKQVEYMTGLNVLKVNVMFRSIDIEQLAKLL